MIDMKYIQKLGVLVWSVFCVIHFSACVTPPPKGPPVEPNFSFLPPGNTPPTRQNMAIAILKPVSVGTFFIDSPYYLNAHKIYIDQMLESAQTDIEKMLINKGFTTAGNYSTIDEMTYSQKERSSLILRPTFTVNLNMPPSGAATINGKIVLDILEPMSREKVWLKQFELAQVTKDVVREMVFVESYEGPRLVAVISKASLIDLLNTFYGAAMSKIWLQIDTNEVKSLKQDADKLKSKTSYRGK